MNNYKLIIKEVKQIFIDAYNLYMKTPAKVLEHKSVNDLLTDVDLNVSNYLIQKLKSTFTNCNVISEENDDDIKTKYLNNTFIIDPLDGTCNYASNNSLFGLQLAYYLENECVLSCIYLPVFNEFYYAIKNEGAYLNDHQITINNNTLTTDGVLGLSDFYSTHPYHIDKQFNIVKALQKTFLKTRLFGAACIDFTSLATNKINTYICYYYHIWDIDPGLLLATEAGCVYKKTIFENKEGEDYIQLIVSNNQTNLDTVLKIVDKINNEYN